MEDGGLPFLGAFADLLVDPKANDTAAGFVRAQISTIVRDPRTAARLCPHQVIGCKRMCVDTNYYDTLNHPHVHLVDLRESPIEAITDRGIRTEGGHNELDVIVYATGFDAMPAR
jgi:cation diffusion facilitator CzcD-associated flavoprotein CzcO